jgi:hypothetical protein
MLEARRAMRMERIFRDRTNPLEIYHDLELIERLRCNETSVFAVAHILSDNAGFYYFVRVNIQGRVCLNVIIRDC